MNKYSPGDLFGLGFIMACLGLWQRDRPLTDAHPVEVVLFALWALAAGMLIGLGIVGMYRESLK